MVQRMVAAEGKARETTAQIWISLFAKTRHVAILNIAGIQMQDRAYWCLTLATTQGDENALRKTGR
jgi:hypothetical protein